LKVSLSSVFKYEIQEKVFLNSSTDRQNRNFLILHPMHSRRNNFRNTMILINCDNGQSPYNISNRDEVHKILLINTIKKCINPPSQYFYRAFVTSNVANVRKLRSSLENVMGMYHFEDLDADGTTVTRQAMYVQRNTEARSRNHCCREKAIKYYIF
jgi:hypothetical protein